MVYISNPFEVIPKRTNYLGAYGSWIESVKPGLLLVCRCPFASDGLRWALESSAWAFGVSEFRLWGGLGYPKP